MSTESASRSFEGRAGATRARSLVAAVPAWAWLTALVGVSAVVRLVLASRHPAPWIFRDELVYAELASSLAESGSFAVRDVAGVQGLGPLYPLLLAPAYALTDRVPDAYAIAKAINALTMSLAAVPAYLLARRAVRPPLAFVAAVLAVAVPSMAYTGTIMTENLYYPAFLFAALGLVLVLERPTLARQLGALALVGVAALTRPQGLALVPAFVTAILVVAILDEREAGGRVRLRALAGRLRPFLATSIALAAGVLVLLALQLLLSGSLGLYESAAAWDVPVSSLLRELVRHAAELDLYLGVLPFAAFLVLAALAFPRGLLPRSLRVLLVAAVALGVWTSVLAAAFVVEVAGPGSATARIEERYLFYLMPFAFIALVAWVERGVPRPWPLAAVAALVAGGLPGLLPYGEIVNRGLISDTLALVPLLHLVEDAGLVYAQLPMLVVLVTLGLSALFLLLPRRLALVAPALVLVLFSLEQRPIEAEINQTSTSVLRSGITVRPDWIDEAVGSDAHVTALWTGNGNTLMFLENEFFNRSVRRFYVLDTAPPLLPTMPEHRVSIDERTGEIVDEGGRPVEAEYVLSHPEVGLAAERVAEDAGLATTLYRVNGKLQIGQKISGIYPDTFSGPRIELTRYACEQGTRLVVLLAADAGLLKRRQSVAAALNGVAVEKVTLAPGERGRLVIPLRPEDGRCEVVLAVSPTVVPAEVLGTDDTRELGVHVAGFRILP